MIPLRYTGKQECSGDFFSLFLLFSVLITNIFFSKVNNHPNVVRFYGVFADNDIDYLVTEYVINHNDMYPIIENFDKFYYFKNVNNLATAIIFLLLGK